MNKKDLWMKCTAITCSFVMTTALLSGCGTSKANNAPSATNSASGSKEPTKISIMIPLFNTEAPAADSPVIKKIEEFANVKLDINFVPSNTYNDKVNVSIAANQLPQMVAVQDIKATSFVNAARSGMFWDLTSQIKDLPNLSKNYDPVMLKNASLDGKNYGLPRGRGLTRAGGVLRKDWLSKLGLQKPTTVDELYNVIKAFATKDPDGNGKDDTVGLVMGAETTGNLFSAFDLIVTAYGGGNGYELKDGKVVPTFMSDPYLKALKWYKRLYDEKLVNLDFPTVKPEQVFEQIDKEKGGLYLSVIDDAERHDNLVKLVQQRDPKLAAKSVADAKMDLLDSIPQLKSVDGTVKVPATAGFNGEFVFPKTSVKAESDLKAILNAFDKLDTPEGQSIIKWGIEGTHYTVKDGLATVSGDTSLVSKEVGTLWQIFLTNQAVDRSSIKGQLAPMREKDLKEETDNMKYAVTDVSVPLISNTQSTKGTDLTKIINDARIKYIMGAINDDGWNQAVAQWKKSGGDQVIQEYTDAYNKTK